MDYRKYRCNLWERLGCLAAGTAVAAAIAWLFYRSWYGMVLVIPVNYLLNKTFVPLYFSFLLQK